MHEINLVPDVKAEMIKTQKLRNLTLFGCIAVSVVSVVLVLITVGIKAGQDIVIGGQDKQMSKMSSKIQEYDGLNEILTVQTQLNKMDELSKNRKMLSRIFNVFSVLLPTGADSITLSELNVNLSTGVLSFDAQADAGEAPLIDYRVLESFKKSVALMKYDYGRYVDENGEQIPTMCIREADSLGNAFTQEGATYAKWTKNVKGCNPSAKNEEASDEEENKEDEEGEESDEGDEKENEAKEVAEITENTVTEAINNGDFEIIWRTPRITKDGDKEGWYSAGYMDLDGNIEKVAHFESECVKYSGNVVGKKVQWSSENNCLLAPEGIKIVSSSNGKDVNNNLVLRFSAAISLDQEVFKFENKHLLAIAPTGRQNVTDSYTQIDNIFGQPASDCLAGDTSCDNALNETGEEGEE